jgi:tetratricopeptide (TPR) repeat protein
VARTLFAGGGTGLSLGLLLALAAAPPRPLRAQDAKPPAAEPAAQPPEQEPPEEDESLKPKVYAFNPLQAQKEIAAGNYYAKKGNHRAAQKRYLEATRWDTSSAEAFLKLGESSEKLHDYSTALEAYTKYLELDKNAKDADGLRKRIAKWPSSKADSSSPGAPKK